MTSIHCVPVLQVQGWRTDPNKEEAARDFFDPEGALATSDEFKDLQEWNSAMP
uniref:Uncharacterized protein n=1 Tax=Oryza sativa subsp. japonica TaxID=39947 RepID=Q69KU9_ORYSJ|nr:hypothetical protein [Oryza sativa Japonica Group]BAD34157.1 hypothetical protein [Oryza sativa Japonica Group]